MEKSKTSEEGCCRPPSRMYVLVVILTAVVTIGSLIVSAFYSWYLDTFDLMQNETESNMTRERKNDFEITPLPEAFIIWGPIYVWRVVFIGYSITSLFSKHKLHRAPAAVYLVLILQVFSGVAWSTVNDMNLYWPGLVTIYGLPITAYICIFLSRRSVVNHNCRYMLYTYMVDNAFAIFAGWTSAACLLYFGITLIYAENGPQLSQGTTGTIMLGILAGELALFVPFELTVLDKYLRHVWTHYLGLFNAIIGSIIYNWDANNRNSIITVALIGFLSCAFLVKMMRIITGCCKRPDMVQLEKELEEDYIKEKF